MSKSRIALVADDHFTVRLGLALTLKDRLGFDEVIEAASLDDALEALGEGKAIDLALFDLSMPGMAGAASLAAVRDIHPDIKIAVVSANDDRDTIIEALRTGIHGYVPKHLSDEQLVRALQRIAENDRYIPDSILLEATGDAPFRNGTNAAALAERLTPRQCQVLRLLIGGKSNKEIARILSLGEGTVKIHMAALFRTLAVKNRAAAVAAGMPLLSFIKA